jgi:hypothetical protein
LQKQKKKYGEYISSLIPKIQTEFNVELHKNSNKLARQKIDELKIYQKMKCKNEYYDEMIKINEKLVNEINYLKKKNDEYEIKSKQKENKFLESKKKLQNQMDNFKIEEEKNEFDINEYLGINNNKNINNINNINNIKNEMDNLNLEKNQINSEEASFEDLRKQHINPNKIDFNKNTINQNFDMPRPEFDFSKSKINENIKAKMKLIDQIDDEINNKSINNNINQPNNNNAQINLIDSNNNKINNNEANFALNNGVKELDKENEKEDDNEFEGYSVKEN